MNVSRRHWRPGQGKLMSFIVVWCGTQAPWRRAHHAPAPFRLPTLLSFFGPPPCAALRDEDEGARSAGHGRSKPWSSDRTATMDTGGGRYLKYRPPLVVGNNDHPNRRAVAGRVPDAARSPSLPPEASNDAVGRGSARPQAGAGGSGSGSAATRHTRGRPAQGPGRSRCRGWLAPASAVRTGRRRRGPWVVRRQPESSCLLVRVTFTVVCARGSG